MPRQHTQAPTPISHAHLPLCRYHQIDKSTHKSSTNLETKNVKEFKNEMKMNYAARQHTQVPTPISHAHSTLLRSPNKIQ
jgi:hypothetical protein